MRIPEHREDGYNTFQLESVAGVFLVQKRQIDQIYTNVGTLNVGGIFFNKKYIEETIYIVRVHDIGEMRITKECYEKLVKWY